MTRNDVDAPLAAQTFASHPPDGEEWLRTLDWRQFEGLIATAYRRQGYTVLPTSPGADGGIDLILTRGPERIFVQCKHWKAWQVGAPVVRELFGLVAANGASRGIVVTSGTFSREAIEFASHSGTELLDGPAVLSLLAIGGVSVQAFATQPMLTSQLPMPAATAATPSTVGPLACPVCLAPMVLHKARRGAQAGSLFWGCSRFPGCRGTRPAEPGTRLPPSPAQIERQRRKQQAAVRELVALAAGGLVLIVAVAVFVQSVSHPVAPSPKKLVPTAPAGAPSSGAAAIGEQPMDIAIDASGKLLYTANYVSGDVTVIDAATLGVVRTIDVPGKPSAIAVSGDTMYVADHSARAVRAIDLKTERTTRTFATGRSPSDVALDPKADRLFVANGESGELWAYSLSSGKRVGTVKGYGTTTMAVDVEEHNVYAVGSVGVITTYRARSLERLHTDFGGSIRGLAVDSKRQRLYTLDSWRLGERNILTGGSRDVATNVTARSLAVDASRRVAYLLDPDSGAIQVVSLK